MTSFRKWRLENPGKLLMYYILATSMYSATAVIIRALTGRDYYDTVDMLSTLGGMTLMFTGVFLIIKSSRSKGDTYAETHIGLGIIAGSLCSFFIGGALADGVWDAIPTTVYRTVHLYDAYTKTPYTFQRPFDASPLYRGFGMAAAMGIMATMFYGLTLPYILNSTKELEHNAEARRRLERLKDHKALHN